ncbi:hypothetical protein Tco_0564841 [Tanacetum coccineum]
MPSEAVEQGMDDHVPDEIDGARYEQLPNHVVKKGIMELENSQNNALAKLPMLKLEEYEIFGGNEATKRTQKALLKQQLQKLVSRLAILGVVTPPKDLNVKFLRSLPSEWDTHVVVWMNKPDFDTMGLDDLMVMYDSSDCDDEVLMTRMRRYDGLPMHPVTSPSPVYVPGPEHPPSPDYVSGPEHPPSPVYVPEPEYPEYLVPSGDEEPMEDQPLPSDASPTARSPGYVADFDLEEDPEEDPEEDHADYPADGRYGDDESSDGDDDADEEDEEVFEDKDDDEEEEEHLASADSSTILVVDHVPSTGDTEAFETEESAPTPPSPRTPQIVVPLSQTRLYRARKTVRPQTPIPFPSEAEVSRLLALLTPPPSSLTPL